MSCRASRRGLVRGRFFSSPLSSSIRFADQACSEWPGTVAYVWLRAMKGRARARRSRCCQGRPRPGSSWLYAAPTERSLVTGSAVVSGTGLLRSGDRHSRTIAGTHGADIEGVAHMQPSDRRPQRERGEELAKAGRPQPPLIRTSAKDRALAVRSCRYDHERRP
jgi:hypothetical protein